MGSLNKFRKEIKQIENKIKRIENRMRKIKQFTNQKVNRLLDWISTKWGMMLMTLIGWGGIVCTSFAKDYLQGFISKEQYFQMDNNLNIKICFFVYHTNG
jgi:endonuclease III